MIKAGIVGFGWWGKTLVEAAEQSDVIRFVSGTTRRVTPEIEADDVAVLGRLDQRLAPPTESDDAGFDHFSCSRDFCALEFALRCYFGQVICQVIWAKSAWRARDEKQPADQAQNDHTVGDIKHLRQARHGVPPCIKSRRVSRRRNPAAWHKRSAVYTSHVCPL